MSEGSLVHIEEGTAVGYGAGAKIPHGERLPKFVIVKAWSFIEMARAGLTLLVGLNGKGKTTFLKYLCGCLEQQPPGKVRTIYLPEELSFGEEMSSKTIIEAVLHGEFLKLGMGYADRMKLDVKKPFGHLSKGNKQKLRLVLTFALSEQGGSELMALDEPLSGLDYELREVVWAIMGEMRLRRQVLVSIHADRIRSKPDGVIAVFNYGVSGDGFIRALSSPVPESWDEIEKQLQEGKE